ncbi:unnamed protein product [Rotaria socialis]|uniref:Uncharacterized protein n=1 Tax=Rotaria socialis TaxID=392032 RepID=A0A821TJD5_9BILA|nr:unnamed protein product [Rotaria socialis]CAF4872432.1 unnamed protein product [Rotaria socialis]
MRRGHLIEQSMAKEHFLPDFRAPLFATSKQTLRLSQLTEPYIVKENSSLYFCSPLLAQFKANVATRSGHRTSHGNRIFLNRLLFTSFAEFEANVASRLTHRTAYAKGPFLKRLLLLHFLTSKKNVVSQSAQRTSHRKGTFITKTLLFSSVALFEANPATGSGQRTSHRK